MQRIEAREEKSEYGSGDGFRTRGPRIPSRESRDVILREAISHDVIFCGLSPSSWRHLFTDSPGLPTLFSHPARRWCLSINYRL